jgi:hypothetical protein
MSEPARAPRLIIRCDHGCIRSVIADQPVQAWLINLDDNDKGLPAGAAMQIEVDVSAVLIDYGRLYQPDEVQALRARQLDFVKRQDTAVPRGSVPMAFFWDGRSFHDAKQERPAVRTFVQFDSDEGLVDFDSGEVMPARAFHYASREAAVRAVHEGRDLTKWSPITSK